MMKMMLWVHYRIVGIQRKYKYFKLVAHFLKAACQHQRLAQYFQLLITNIYSKK